MFVQLWVFLDRNMNISIADSGFQDVENIAEIWAKIVLNERARFQFQRAEIAYCAQLFGWVCIKSWTISSCVRNCLNVASWEMGVLYSFASTVNQKNDSGVLLQPVKS